MTERAASVEIPEFERILRTGDPAATLLLDVRNPVEAARWRPEGAGIRSYANVPYFEFIEDEDGAARQVPQAAQVYVLCAKGGSSDYVAQLLRDRGIAAANIAGGMIAWAQHHRVTRINPITDSFALYQVARPAKGCLSYILIADGEALVTDATRYAEIYRDFVERHGARIVATVDTHLHADHVSGGAPLAAEHDAPYYLADEDAAGASLAREPMPKRFAIGKTRVDVIALPVPGHTLGSTALLIDDRYLISGDTLLPDGVGRPDLGNQARAWSGYLYDSLEQVLSRLDPGITVLPAHVASALQYGRDGSCVRNLGDLLAVQSIGDRVAFLDRVESIVAKTSQPPEYAEIRRVNLGQHVSPQRLEELEIGENRCALSASKG